MNNRQTIAWGWIRKGDNDLRTARQSLQLEGPYDTASFHCQQAAEKYLKAVFAYCDLPIPRIHDLKDLQLALGEPVPALDLSSLDLSQLTPFAVEVRYDPEFMPTRQDVEDAVALAERVRATVLAVLPPEAAT